MDKKENQENKNKNVSFGQKNGEENRKEKMSEEMETEKSGFVPQYFEWVDIEKQKEIVEKLEKIE